MFLPVFVPVNYRQQSFFIVLALLNLAKYILPLTNWFQGSKDVIFSVFK